MILKQRLYRPQSPILQDFVPGSTLEVSIRGLLERRSHVYCKPPQSSHCSIEVWCKWTFLLLFKWIIYLMGAKKKRFKNFESEPLNTRSRSSSLFSSWLETKLQARKKEQSRQRRSWVQEVEHRGEPTSSCCNLQGGDPPAAGPLRQRAPSRSCRYVWAETRSRGEDGLCSRVLSDLVKQKLIHLNCRVVALMQQGKMSSVSYYPTAF